MPAKIDVAAEIASAHERNDEALNVALAGKVAKAGDQAAVAELIDILEFGKRDAQSDAIKVLYEIGALKPDLIAGHIPAFLNGMQSANNRLVWGCLTALTTICRVNPGAVFARLEAILHTADKGSVIAKDQAMAMLTILAGDQKYAQKVVPILLARLEASAVNQTPMYAERALPVLTAADKPAFACILEARLADPMAESKRKRIAAVLKKLSS